MGMVCEILISKRPIACRKIRAQMDYVHASALLQYHKITTKDYSHSNLMVGNNKQKNKYITNIYIYITPKTAETENDKKRQIERETIGLAAFSRTFENLKK